MDPARTTRGSRIEAARAGQLPHPIELADIRGDLQVHTNATDGVHDLADMVGAARSKLARARNLRIPVMSEREFVVRYRGARRGTYLNGEWTCEEVSESAVRASAARLLLRR